MDKIEGARSRAGEGRNDEGEKRGFDGVETEERRRRRC